MTSLAHLATILIPLAIIGWLLYMIVQHLHAVGL
jgi:hypothetical protein